MNKVIILGCSHAAGTELSSEPGLITSDPSTYEENNSYPALLAQHLGYRYSNLASVGNSNDTIFRNFLEQLKFLNSGDVVIVAWTGCNRSEIFYNNKWNNIVSGHDPKNFGPELLRFHQTWLMFQATMPSAGKQNKYKNIIALNSIAKMHNLKVINLDSFWPIREDFSWVPDVYWAVDEDFDTWCMKRKYPTSPTRHFYSSAHRDFAEYVFKSLDI